MGYTMDTPSIHLEWHPGEVPEPCDLPLVGHTSDTPPTYRGGLSELAMAIRARLDLYPKEAREPAGYIANTIWAHSPPGSGKPTAADVLEALGELERAGTREAA
jgi:hypothetical protein